MALEQYRSGDLVILRKTIMGTPKGKPVALGMAFRTHDAPIGYLPFYGPHDFDFSGDTSWKEQVLARLPVDLSPTGSPHALLLQQTAGDVGFLGSGDEYLTDIQRPVRQDLLRYAMHCASGAFIDGVMVALGGPTLKSAARLALRSKVQQFIFSRAMGGAAKHLLKMQRGFDSSFLAAGP